MFYPNVLAVRRMVDEANKVSLDLHIPIELAYFSGHFPSLPVLPGVVQIDWAVRYARQHLTLSGDFTALENIKFQSLVLPDAKLELILIWNELKKQLEFSYTTSKRQHSSGRIVFGGAA